jgi:lipase
MSSRTHDVPVDGGTLRVGQWGPADPDRSVVPTVIAVHGITSSHLAWPRSPERCRRSLIAADLLGRGRSAGLPGPFGMARHARDLKAMIEVLQLPPAILVGHAMGGFVAVVAAHLYPDRFKAVLLIDGGLPLAIPAGISEHDLPEVILGPAVRRLSMTSRIA